MSCVWARYLLEMSGTLLPCSCSVSSLLLELGVV